MERKVFQCDLCRAKYSQKAKLNFHLKSKHTMEKVVSVSCTLCSKKFATKRGRLDHEKNVHLGAKEHSCKECGDTFCTKYRLDGHIRSKHGNKLQCPKCKKCFLYPHTLRQHTSRCVDERDTVFTCKKCNTDYSTKRALDDHTKAESTFVKCVLLNLVTIRHTIGTKNPSMLHERLCSWRMLFILL